MAIEVKASTGGELKPRKVYTGLANFIVKAINPSMEELKTLGINAQQEPNYFHENDGVKSVRIDVYLSNPELELENIKMVFFIKNAPKKSKIENTQFINKYGRTTYAVSQDELAQNQYFINEGVRAAFDGEADFVDQFIRAWVEAKYNTKDKEFSSILPDMDKIFKGDFSELKAIVKGYPNNGVRVLLTAKEGKDGNVYQSVYTRHIERTWMKSTNKFEEALNDQYTQCKEDYQHSLTLMQYVKKDSGNLIRPDAVSPAQVVDDLPF